MFMALVSGWNYLSYIGTIVGLVAVSIGVTRWLYRGAMRSVKTAVEPIIKEMTPNGGSSMKDHVNAVRRDVAVIRQQLDDVKEAVGKDVIRIDGAIVHINGRIDDLMGKQ